MVETSMKTALVFFLFLEIKFCAVDGKLGLGFSGDCFAMMCSFQAFISQNTRKLSDPKAVFEIQTLSIRSKVFSPKTKAKFLVDLRFFRLAFKTNEN